MASATEWVDVVSKLNQLTLEGRLEWERMDPPAAISSGVNDRVFNFFGTTYRGRRLGIHEERHQTYHDDLDRYIWQRRVVLGFYTDDWELQVEAPEVSGLQELYETVKHQEAELDGFVESLLKED